MGRDVRLWEEDTWGIVGTIAATLDGGGLRWGSRGVEVEGTREEKGGT
jgi:hypothetical protein